MNKLFITLLASTKAAGAGWDYLKNGDDWGQLPIAGNLCGGTNQSPIDLPSTVAEDKMILSSKDNF